MDTRMIKLPSPGRRKGRYSDAFKAQIVSACEEPGVSTAAVALANSLNANLVRRWVAASRVEGVAPGQGNALLGGAGEFKPVAEFVSLPVGQGGVAGSAGDIRLELRSGSRVLTLYWPVTAAAQCLEALKDWGR